MSALAAEIAANPAFRRRVERLCRQPRRLLLELLAEIAADHGLAREIEARLDRYNSIRADALAVTGGDRLPNLPIHEVIDA
jgi:hypothetical protein